MIFNCCSDCEVFPKNHAAPFSKVLTFYRKEPFSLEAYYNFPNELPYPDPIIGEHLNLRKCGTHLTTRANKEWALGSSAVIDSWFLLVLRCVPAFSDVWPLEAINAPDAGIQIPSALGIFVPTFTYFFLSSGQFLIQKVVPQASGESSKVKVKVRVNIHGIFSVSSASLVEVQKSDETEEPMETEQASEKDGEVLQMML